MCGLGWIVDQSQPRTGQTFFLTLVVIDQSRDTTASSSVVIPVRRRRCRHVPCVGGRALEGEPPAAALEEGEQGLLQGCVAVALVTSLANYG